jgi:type 1 glutamine amidotransferase
MLVVTQVAPYGTEAPHQPGPAGVHGVLPQAATALAQLAEIEGLAPRLSSDVTTLQPEDLDDARILCLFTIGETPFSAAQQASIESSWLSGELAILAVHSATDACYGWPAYQRLLGARFDGHPWTQDVAIDVDTDHAATAELGPQWLWRDEIYLFRDLRPDVRVLLRVSQEQLDLSSHAGRLPDWGVPLAWCHQEGGGRSFYSSLGHFPKAWERSDHLRYLAGALRWLLGGQPDGH